MDKINILLLFYLLNHMIVFYPVWFYLVPEDGSFMSEKREPKIVEDVPSTKNVLDKDRDWSDFK